MTEQQLEQALIKQLQGLEYQAVKITNEKSLLDNLKTQLEKLNRKALQNTPLSDEEFKQILNHLNTGTIFDRAKILRDQFVLKRPNENIRISFISSAKDWCQNHFQVTSQVTMKGEHHNRYDVTLLINGLPMVQIELKKRGIEIKEAFNQIRRYKNNQSYKTGAGLFEYIQIFIISNSVNTKYFANNKTELIRFEQTFFWTDRDNTQYDDLHQFTNAFLKPCHITKMIGQYTILNETNQMLMIMRPYQVYAVEAISNQIKNTDQNGYIWHTTGSGKTLTSFKASQIIASNPDVQKILFVVDRKDLDDQTVQEFNKFAKDSVDTTSNTKNLVNQLTDNNKKLIVTTIQKLNRAIQNTRYHEDIKHLQKQKIIFIFDECHRSQFGKTHQNIKKFFQKAQMFGFTGTPILSENAKTPLGERPLTTKDLFDKCLHKYLIVDAIRDKNVLGFSIEYIGKYQRTDSTNEIDINTDSFEENKASLEDERRLSKIVDYIQTHHDHKTKSRAFTAMFCVSNVPTLIKYYDLFKQQPIEKPLKIATIFSYGANEPSIDDMGILPEEALELPSDTNINPSYRDKLTQYINDYNQIFTTQHVLTDSQSFETYYKDIAKRVRHGQIDILLVVNMFLTGFDSPRLNTLYVDKNLKLHGLIQAFSRTNRLFDVKKSHGNIVCFRNLKAATDEAIRLFSNKDAKEIVDGILVKSYEEYVQDYNQAVTELQAITPTVDSVKNLSNEDEQVEFIKRFRALARLENILNTFADFSETDLNLSKQEVDGFRGKFLDLKDMAQEQNDETSLLQQVDFEMDLIHRDEINVKYILDLLSQLKDKPQAQEDQFNAIFNLLNNQAQLRNKRPLIEKFMQQVDLKAGISQQFAEFWHGEYEQTITELCTVEKLIESELRKCLINYQHTNQLPRNDEIAKMLNFQISILHRQPTIERIRNKIIQLIEIFIEDMGGTV